MHFPNHLFVCRQKFALTQQEVSHFLGVARSTVTRVEAGAEPSVTFAIGCAYLFGTPLSEFFPTLVAEVREHMIPALADFSILVEGEDEAAPEREQRQAFLAEITAREDDENSRYGL